MNYIGIPGARFPSLMIQTPFQVSGARKLCPIDPFVLLIRVLVKVRMSSGPEIRGFSPVGSQYGNFCSVPRYFPRNLQKPETRPIFAMAKMSPRESHFLVVDVVRWAPNLHMFNSTHQDLSLHRECLLISDGKGWYQCPVGWGHRNA